VLSFAPPSTEKERERQAAAAAESDSDDDEQVSGRARNRKRRKLAEIETAAAAVTKGPSAAQLHREGTSRIYLHSNLVYLVHPVRRVFFCTSSDVTIMSRHYSSPANCS
jgi:hypothetical protein